MSESSGDIIIKGGSVQLHFDGTAYPKDPSDPRKHSNPYKRIARIIIDGDIQFDSGNHPDGLRCMIKVLCK